MSRIPVGPGEELRIRARRHVGAKPVGQAFVLTVAGGPRPSIVNMPGPGCWRLRLQWSGHLDTLDIHYRYVAWQRRSSGPRRAARVDRSVN
ncbi:hypothetical protein DVA67_034395 [Solirubrobacter sp. CPCC 204708]|nr:hypothetical protein [Solirubrobacter deserti]